MDEDRVPEIDYSVFHPLMHTIFSFECFGWYGGPTRHLRLWWEFKLRDQLEGSIRRPLFCRRQRHEWVDYWTGPLLGPKAMEEKEPTGKMCAWCWVKRENG